MQNDHNMKMIHFIQGFAIMVCLLLMTAFTNTWIPSALAEAGSMHSEAADIPIDEAHFPDEKFREYIRGAGFDANADGILSISERKKVTMINCDSCSITDLTGISFFPEVFQLMCNNNQLTKLDLSGNPEMKMLLCYSNRLTMLNVSQNPKLDLLLCFDNLLTSLDVSANTMITGLDCHENQLFSLDVSHNPQLIMLGCGKNQLTELNFSANPKLAQLLCDGNRLMTLDVSHNPKLTMLDCRSNLLTELDLREQTLLEALYCNDNQIAQLDISPCAALTDLVQNGKRDKLPYWDFWEQESPQLQLMTDSGVTVIAGDYTSTP